MAMAPPAPSVSVVMPVYQADAFLAAAIESLLAQSYPDFELIAVDDGSTDGSSRILEEYAKRDLRLIVHRRRHDGVIRARNAGLALARAPLIACMDADDISLPDRLAAQVSALASRPEVSCIGGGFEVIDECGRLLNRVLPPCEHAEIVAMALSGRSPICGSNAMFRRSEVQAIGGYHESADFVEDLDLWLRLAETGRLANLGAVISRVRFHDASQSASEQERQLDAIREVVNRARARRGIAEPIERPAPWRPLGTRRSRQQLAVGWARSAWRLGQRRTALRYVVRALRIDPLGPPLWSGLARGFARLFSRATCPK
jgi:glycosyltransferase involved in cell wall biosynthesis